MVFLFFLGLSACFWLFVSLNEDYEMDFSVQVRLRGVPENVVVTNDLPSTIHVVLKDKGAILYKYRYSGLPVITVDFSSYDQHSGHVSLLTSDVIKQWAGKLLATTRLVSYKPDTLEYYYNYGLHMRLPVIVKASLQPEKFYSVSSVRVIPDSVTVYASQEVLDTMTAVTTEHFYLSDFSDKRVRSVRLARVKGAKIEPQQVTVRIYVDQMTEKTVFVPVKWVNFPATKVLRTFPSKVKVTFQVGMSMYRKINADDFVLVVNYEDLLKSTNGKVHLNLKSLPVGVSHVRIIPEDVDFLIEDASEEN